MKRHGMACGGKKFASQSIVSCAELRTLVGASSGYVL